MNEELANYRRELALVLDRLARLLEGLPARQLNWRPPAPNMNSLHVLATHIMGNMESWLLGIVCGQDVTRDRDAEFRAVGDDPAALIERAQALAGRIDQALGALAPAALEETRRPAPPLVGIGPQEELTVRRALLRTLVHALMHVGQMQITRDLAVAQA